MKPDVTFFCGLWVRCFHFSANRGVCKSNWRLELCHISLMKHPCPHRISRDLQPIPPISPNYCNSLRITVTYLQDDTYSMLCVLLMSLRCSGGTNSAFCLYEYTPEGFPQPVSRDQLSAEPQLYYICNHSQLQIILSFSIAWLMEKKSTQWHLSPCYFLSICQHSKNVFIEEFYALNIRTRTAPEKWFLSQSACSCFSCMLIQGHETDCSILCVSSWWMFLRCSPFNSLISFLYYLSEDPIHVCSNP